MTREPEEIIEAALVETLSSALSAASLTTAAPAVLGALSPVAEGAVKSADDSFVSVFVDLTEQPLDWIGATIPLTFSARVVVHFANADEPSGEGFRNLCRAVRSALLPLLGDGCENLTTTLFACDSVTLDNTSTSLDADAESGGLSKTYTLSIAGRVINNESKE